MPLISEPPSTDEREDFCRALKTARERKGITLSQIGESTKIPAYLFASLERNDLGRWPKGLFRRSFFRDYVRAIGLPVNETCEQFVRLFPEHETKELNRRPESGEPLKRADDLRLAFDDTWRGPRASVTLRLIAAVLDAAAVIGTAAALGRVTGTDLLPSLGVVALAYLTLATTLFGESPAKFIIEGRRSILGAIASVSGSNGADAPGAVEEPQGREWITDARRVGPPPRLRVRIKVSH